MNYRKTRAYKWYRHMAPLHELKILLKERRRFIQEARSAFNTTNPPGGTFSDYMRAWRKHRVSYAEYMYKYEYWKLNEIERDKFISCSEMQAIYRKTVDPVVRNVFFTKTKFLSVYSDYIHRRWGVVRDMNLEMFADMVQSFDCIAKPIMGSRGCGIFKIPQQCSDSEIEKLFEMCKQDNVLLEECIHAYPTIAAFHPASLNTIRVVTVSNETECVIFGALLRMGAGDSFIDNTHSGGIYASIDVKSGVIDTDGIDSLGNHYSRHPDTGLPIKGFQIPYWNRLVEACQSASRVMPKTLFAGWDICVREDGRIELIEGNHAPDFDGGMQVPKKIGVKKKVQAIAARLMGWDILKLIPFYSKTYNRYAYLDFCEYDTNQNQ